MSDRFNLLENIKGILCLVVEQILPCSSSKSSLFGLNEIQLATKIVLQVYEVKIFLSQGQHSIPVSRGRIMKVHLVKTFKFKNLSNLSIFIKTVIGVYHVAV